MRLQAAVREKLSPEFGIRLHRKNLSERLQLESSLVRGFFRLVNQIAIFGMLLIALVFTGDPSAKRGIYNNLSKCFPKQGPC